MKVRANLVAVAVLLAVGARAQLATPQPTVTEGDVVAGMAKKGVSVSVEQVRMPSTIPARTEHPALEAMKIEPFASNSSRVLMRCTDRRSCIPFYVVVNGMPASQALANFVPREALKQRAALSAASAPLVIRQGSAATLQIVAPEMLITIPVVCLQNGRQGETIKVSSTDRKKTYLGEVASPGLLRSRL